MQAKVDAKEDFMERKREEQAKLREARAEEARIKDELARKRLDYKASSRPPLPLPSARRLSHLLFLLHNVTTFNFSGCSYEDAAKIECLLAAQAGRGRHV